VSVSRVYSYRYKVEALPRRAHHPWQSGLLMKTDCHRTDPTAIKKLKLVPSL